MQQLGVKRTISLPLSLSVALVGGLAKIKINETQRLTRKPGLY